MYSRNKKDNYRKKIEELITGRTKKIEELVVERQQCDADNDIIIAVDGSSNEIINDDSTSNINEDINKISEELIVGRPKHLREDETINDDDSMSNIDEGINMISGDICVQKWNPGSTRIEGIRKYLGTNKINLITKIIVIYNRTIGES